MVMQEIELFELRQPAVGGYNILFKNRAAKELADLLAPIFSMKVDFEHDYHHVAWAGDFEKSPLKPPQVGGSFLWFSTIGLK